MLIVRGNLRCKVTRSTDEERAWLETYLSFPDKRFTARKGKDGEKPRVSMMNVLDGTFPAGFLPLVTEAAPKEGIKVDILDKRRAPCQHDPMADLEWLWRHPAVEGDITHQIEAVHAVMKEKRGILWIPTGGGKTEAAIGCWKLLPCRWLFMVHRTGLMHQTAERFTLRTGKAAGLVGDETWQPALAARGFTVATFQTVAAAIKKGDPRAVALLKAAEGVIFDEGHTLPAASFWGVAMRTPNAYFRVSMSGTPLARGDQKSIWAIGATGPVIYRVRADELIKLGILAKPTIRMLPLEQWAGGIDDSWNGVYKELVSESKVRNLLLTNIARMAAKPALLFVKEIDHGRHLEKQLRSAGIQCEFVWGEKDTPRRASAIRRLVRGDIDVLICSVIFQEGLDVPELAAVINGSGGASVIGALQRVGRGTRATEEKRSCEVWDIEDRGDKWLTKHARRRKRAYISEGYEVLAMAAPSGALTK